LILLKFSRLKGISIGLLKEMLTTPIGEKSSTHTVRFSL
jgi:hypothetical protein